MINFAIIRHEYLKYVDKLNSNAFSKNAPMTKNIFISYKISILKILQLFLFICVILQYFDQGLPIQNIS